MCDGETRCSVAADHRVLGDPCPGRTKILRLNYTCKARESKLTLSMLSKCFGFFFFVCQFFIFFPQTFMIFHVNFFSSSYSDSDWILAFLNCRERSVLYACDTNFYSRPNFSAKITSAITVEYSLCNTVYGTKVLTKQPVQTYGIHHIKY